jgi:hypothetical protein
MVNDLRVALHVWQPHHDPQPLPPAPVLVPAPPPPSTTEPPEVIPTGVLPTPESPPIRTA